MKALHFRVVIVLALLVQAGFLIHPGDKLADPYRYEERQKAFHTWAVEQTPAAREAWNRERGLLYDHQMRIAVGTLFVLLVADATVIYFFWNYGITKRAV